jgi:2-isopropylmalate synthase
VNFKVRILDENKGTGAVTRVLLDASDGSDAWGSIGVSENVIEASWEALVDSLEAGMLPGRAERAGRAAGAAGAAPVDGLRGRSGRCRESLS